MKKIIIPMEELVKMANDFKEKNVEFHFHHIPPKCALEENSKHQIVIENEGNGMIFAAESEGRPNEELKEFAKLVGIA